MEFRLVVFRPFKGEIIQGKIGHSDNKSIESTSALPTKSIHTSNSTSVDLDFFGDITIPAPVNLFAGTTLYVGQHFSW